MEEPRRTRHTSRGECNFCHGVFGKAGMARHLESCPQRRAALVAPPPGPKRAKSFHLVVSGRYSPDYWLHLEVPGKMTLGNLDGFLRKIWLECCGHLSAFTIEGRRYTSSLFGGYQAPGEHTMDHALQKVLRPAMTFGHQYDFGSTTNLTVKVLSERAGGPGEEIVLMARNLPPDLRCSSCGEPATQVCTNCVYDGDGGWLCDRCVEEHECGDDMLLPVVNSPRMGVCGYTG